MPSRLISNSASELVTRNRMRKSMVFQNEDAAIDIFIKRESPGSNTVSTTDHDHRLSAGGSLALNFDVDGKEAIQDRWTCIAASGTPRVSLFETEDIIR